MPRRPRRTHRLYSVSVNRVGLSAKVHSAQPRPNVDRSRCLMKGSFVRRSHADLSSSRTEAASFVRARGPFNYSASHLAVGYGMARRIRMPSDLSLRSRNKIKKKKKSKGKKGKAFMATRDGLGEGNACTNKIDFQQRSACPLRRTCRERAGGAPLIHRY